MARRKKSHLVSEWRKARFHMRPDRILARFASGGKHNSLGGIAKSVAKTKAVSKQTPQNHQRLIAAQARKAAPAKKAAAKKAAAPAKGTAKKTVAVRKKNGQFNGREAMGPAEAAMYERAFNRAGLPPEIGGPRRLFDR